uniref:Minor capsid protein n=1 Tax=Siphoviridae sp. ctoyo6 TaxID=2825674 RepID=A0A8S5U327_9CAUD|nr:MAG TPA: Minor capsid protein [Siphoviridae sp. ctoyo6]
MSKANYNCTFNLDDCIKTLGLEENGRVQRFVTSEFQKNVEPYVPMDEAEKYENPGRLIDSCHIENGTDVVWNTPYARRLYYHPEYNFQGAPTRGGYWADRYMQNGGQQEIEDGVRRLLRR